MNVITTKKCSTCKEEKRITEFNKNKSRKDGHEYICRLCKKIRAAKYYVENSNLLLANKAEYYQDSKERISIRGKEYNKIKVVECEICKSIVRKHGLKRHQRTIKCKAAICIFDAEE